MNIEACVDEDWPEAWTEEQNSGRRGRRTLAPQPASPHNKSCHSERRKIIRKADDLAESRNLLSADTTTAHLELDFRALCEEWDSTTASLGGFGKRHNREGHDFGRTVSLEKQTAASCTVEERRFSAASGALRETGLQPRWHRIQRHSRTRLRKRITRRLPHQPRAYGIQTNVLAMPAHSPPHLGSVFSTANSPARPESSPPSLVENQHPPLMNCTARSNEISTAGVSNT